MVLATLATATEMLSGLDTMDYPTTCSKMLATLHTALDKIATKLIPNTAMPHNQFN